MHQQQKPYIIYGKTQIVNWWQLEKKLLINQYKLEHHETQTKIIQKKRS